MKKKINESELEEIIRFYGSLEAYNEEQRRCGLAQIEAVIQINPFAEQINIENAMPVELLENRLGLQSFWLKFSARKRKTRLSYISPSKIVDDTSGC